MIVPINDHKVPEQLAVLRRPCVKGDVGPAALLAIDLIDTAKSHAPNCVGLAANQVWRSDDPTPHVFVAWVRGQWMTFINATSSRSGKRVSMEEGCMSIPGEKRRTKRRTRIRLKYLDEDGKARNEEFRGFDAIILQHELDHCTGTLI